MDVYGHSPYHVLFKVKKSNLEDNYKNIQNIYSIIRHSVREKRYKRQLNAKVNKVDQSDGSPEHKLFDALLSEDSFNHRGILSASGKTFGL